MALPPRPPYQGEIWLSQNEYGAFPGGILVSWAGVYHPSPVPRLRLRLDRRDGNVRAAVTVHLGQTVAIGDERWRLADITEGSMYSRLSFLLRRADENEKREPPAGPFPAGVELQPLGWLGEPGVVAVETALGVRLPPIYREWLRTTNGARPAVPYGQVSERYSQWRYRLVPELPFLGVHPGRPELDLLSVRQQKRHGLLSDKDLIIAEVGGIGGLLVLTTAGPETEAISLLPPEEHAQRVPLAADLESFLGHLQPSTGDPAEWYMNSPLRMPLR